jgi:demethylmenaquinone methyltransferase/2-methoxy-6-polyprenyl-1,4-benzoquinol methylase
MASYFLHPDSIRKLFGSVAPRYDFLNHLLSLRRDIYWRKKAVGQLAESEGWILDMATGTGDVAIEIIHQYGDGRKVFGLDFSEPMIRGAYQKLLKKRLSGKITLSLGDALYLPFRNSAFSAAIIAFGLRNMQDKEQALSEMIRVTKEGGKVIVLEFTLPRRGLMKALYPIYFKRILPRVGGFISGDQGAYAYLPESVFLFRYAAQYEELMRRSGLERVHSTTLTGGVASIIAGIKKDR